MINNKNYIIISFFLLIVTIILVFTNVIVLNKILLKSAVAYKSVKITEQMPKIFGYSDMLSVIFENSNLELLNITDAKTRKGIINVDIKFSCIKEELTSILTYVTSKDNFKNMNCITINTENKVIDKNNLLLEGTINADFIKDDNN